MITFFTSNTTLTFPVKCVVIIKNSHCDQRNNTRMPRQTKEKRRKKRKIIIGTESFFKDIQLLIKTQPSTISTSNVI